MLVYFYGNGGGNLHRSRGLPGEMGHDKTDWADARDTGFFGKERLYRPLEEDPFKNSHGEWTRLAVIDDHGKRGYKNGRDGDYGYDHDSSRHFSFLDHKDRKEDSIPVPEPSTLLLLGSALLGLGVKSRRRVPR